MFDDPDHRTDHDAAPERLATEPPADDAVRHERRLDVSIDDAWELLATPEGMERWLGDRVDLDVEPGSTGTIVDRDEELLIEVESVEPGRRVSLRWWSEERGAAVVDLIVEPLADDATRLVVVEVPVRALRIPAAPIGLPAAPPRGPQMFALA